MAIACMRHVLLSIHPFIPRLQHAVTPVNVPGLLLNDHVYVAFDAFTPTLYTNKMGHTFKRYMRFINNDMVL